MILFSPDLSCEKTYLFTIHNSSKFIPVLVKLASNWIIHGLPDTVPAVEYFYVRYCYISRSGNCWNLIRLQCNSPKIDNVKLPEVGTVRIQLHTIFKVKRSFHIRFHTIRTYVILTVFLRVV